MLKTMLAAQGTPRERVPPPFCNAGQRPRKWRRRSAADEATDRAWGTDPNQPTSWASLGEDKAGPETIEVPAFLQIAPALLGIFSVTIFIANSAGVFGEEPDLDKLAADIEALGKI